MEKLTVPRNYRPITLVEIITGVGIFVLMVTNPVLLIMMCLGYIMYKYRQIIAEELFNQYGRFGIYFGSFREAITNKDTQEKQNPDEIFNQEDVDSSCPISKKQD